MSEQRERHDEDAATAAAIRRAFSRYRAPAGQALPATRPAQPVWQRPLPLAVSVSAMSLAAALVAAVFIFQTLAQPQSAYASWKPVPDSPDPVMASIAEDECRPMLRAADEETPAKGWAKPSELPLVAQDLRGEVALALFGDGQTFASCVVTRSGQSGATALGIGQIEGQLKGSLRLLGGISYEGEPPLRTLLGDVSAQVASVIIERDDGQQVTATVEQGYFLAWWPTSAEAVRIVAYDSAGSVIGSLSGSQLD